MRAMLNRWRRRWLRALKFRPLFGERSQGRLLPHTRISPSTCIEHEDQLTLADHVFIGHFNFIEASGGVTIDEGVQVTSHVAIVTHSSHRAQRLLGRAYADWPAALPDWSPEGAEPPQPDWISGKPLPKKAHVTPPRPGWIAGPVHIGAYSFIGPHSLIEANTRLGRGCIVCAGAQVRGEFTDFSVIEGVPGRVVGDSRRGDEAWLVRHPELLPFYEAWAGEAPSAGRRRPRGR
ncbi:acyltransferase [Sphaerotilus microaerophilus]|nr:acyltransferase [Sphaerotilus sp. FB-5]